VLRTGEISRSTNKGRHVTEHRELFVLGNGAIIIDTPGMKELGVTDDGDGIAATFDDIHELAQGCRFPDCRHMGEAGCAVIEAVNSGSVSRESYENYLKIQKEQERFQTTVAEKRRQEKQFGKLIKTYYKIKNSENPE
jgi:ribosome biogenesis GTPase